MKKLISVLAVAAFMFSMNVMAQEPQQKEKAKTEKSCSKEEKKSCSKDGEKKGGCCSAKKASENKK